MRWMTRPSYLALVALAAASGCRAREGREGAPVASVAPPAVTAVPPVAVANEGAPGAPASGVPAAEPYEQALAYETAGQLWLARLVLEKPALTEGAPPREAELLARLCAAQGDEECVKKCGARLGRKLAFDAGAPPGASLLPSARPVDSDDASRAQRALLKGDAEGARRLLQPKLVAKTITGPELSVLRAACERQRDTMCVLACDGAKKR